MSINKPMKRNVKRNRVNKDETVKIASLRDEVNNDPYPGEPPINIKDLRKYKRAKYVQPVSCL